MKYFFVEHVPKRVSSHYQFVGGIIHDDSDRWFKMIVRCQPQTANDILEGNPVAYTVRWIECTEEDVEYYL